jgi:hypothetical protein
VHRSLPLLVTLLVASASPASATAVLDQQQTTHDGSWVAVGVPGYEGATFTAGLSGLLTQLDAYLSKRGDPGDITLEIHSCSGGIPVALLGSLTYPSSVITTSDGVFDWHAFDLSSLAISVVAGAQYAYAFRAQVYNNDPNYLMVTVCGLDPYAGGGYVFQYPWVNDGIPVVDTFNDGVFRTWVNAPTAVRDTGWGGVKALFR